MGKAKVIFQPSGRRGEVEKGINIIEASRLLGVDIETLCGEKKVCGKCKVRIEKGTSEKFGIVSDPAHVSPWQEEEEKFITPEQRESGYRLGCVAGIEGDLLIFVPEESRAGKQVVSKAARDIDIQWNPAVKIYTVTVTPPTFEDPLGDFERMSNDIIEGLNELVKKACEGTHPPKKKQKDENGKVVKDSNGQPVMVEDPEEGKTYLRLEPSDIVDLTLGGNTAMHHILLKLDPYYVGLGPFPPVIHRSLDIGARDLGIGINKSSNVFIMPNEAGFVGADNVCVLVTEKPHKSDQIQLIIDIGTNGELVLGNREKLVSSSCATGPALEGAQLAFGMRAAPGAIERIKIDPETHEVEYKVIGRDAWLTYSKPEEMQTKGICGSGIPDVLAELYCSGVVEKSGRFSKKQKSNRFRKNADNSRQKEFVIAWANETSIGKDVVITQKDIRQIQLAKGALYTGCKLMMRRMGIDKVNTIKIAGAFGTHVDREKALIMGLFPDCDLEKVLSVGNAAGDGARVVLLDRDMRTDAGWISRNFEYIELTVEKDFQREFMESMQIPHMTDPFPHLVGLVPDEVLQQ